MQELASTGKMNKSLKKNPKNAQPDSLDVFKHYPQPIFLIDQNMNLLEQNLKGAQAIDKHWLATISGKLHFNSKKNDNHVLKVMESLKSGKRHSERFVFPSGDAVYRAYTITKAASSSNSNFLLCIHDNMVDSKQRMKAVMKAFSLSSSESKVLNSMVNGLKPKQIAYEVGISLYTVRSHLRTLYAKMHVRDYNEALMLAVRLLD